jgi:hypothetical protein
MIPASPAHAQDLDMSRKKYGAIMPDKWYDDLGVCETGHKIGNLQHSTRSYTGAYGLYRGTAATWGGGRDVTRLTRRQQIRIVDRISFAGWERPGHPKVWPVGPFGFGSVRNGCGQLLEFICHATHNRVQRYRARACRLGGANG